MDNRSLESVTAEARRVKGRHAEPVIVTECRLSRTARKTWFNFRFAVNESTAIGREIVREDRSVEVIRAVIA